MDFYYYKKLLLRCRKGIGKTYMGTEIVKEKRGQPTADNQCVTKKAWTRVWTGFGYSVFSVR